MTTGRPLNLLSLTRRATPPLAAPLPLERPREALREPAPPRGALIDRGIQNLRPVPAPPSRTNAVDRVRGAISLGEHELGDAQGEALDRLRDPRDLATARRDLLSVTRALSPAARDDAALAGALALLRDQTLTTLGRHHGAPVALERGMNTVLGITSTTPEARLDARGRQTLASLRAIARDTNALMRGGRALASDYRAPEGPEEPGEDPSTFEHPGIGAGNIPTDVDPMARHPSTEPGDPARIITHVRRFNSPGSSDHVAARIGTTRAGISISAAGGRALVTGGNASDEGAAAVTMRLGNLVAGLIPGEYVTHPAFRGRPEIGVSSTVTGGLTDQIRLPDGSLLRLYGGAHVHTVGRYGGAHFSIIRDDGRRTLELNGSFDRAIGIELRLRGRF